MKRLSLFIGHMACCLAFCVPLALASCSSSDDDEQQNPQPNELKTLEQGNDQRPDWHTPDFDTYELTMSIELRLQDTLQAYASSQDLLCATIGNEVCGMATPKQVDDVWLFPLTVGSNNGNAAITLSYYCDRLHRIFTTPWTTFDATAAPMGLGGIYEPIFVK